MMDSNDCSFRIASLKDANSVSLIENSFGSQLRQDLLSLADLTRSGGPWLVVNTDQVVFDGINAGYGLGYNAGPLFGTAQYAGAWTGDWSDPDVQAVGRAFDHFVERKPKWESRRTDFSTPKELICGYISTNVLEQFDGRHVELNSELQSVLASVASRKLQSRSKEFLHKANFIDYKLCCQFDVSGPSLCQRLASHGVIAACNGATTAEIEIPLSVTQTDLELLAERLISAWLDEPPAQSSVLLRDYHHYYTFHAQLIRSKQMAAAGHPLGIMQTLESLQQLMPPGLRDVAKLHYLTRDTWSGFRAQVEALQEHVYEPARQTSLATFDKLFEDDFGFGLLILVDGTVAGMASAGPLILFPGERGTLADTCRGDRHVLYPLDLTVTEQYRGSLGTYLKRGMVLLGLASGHRAFHGRNRDRLAAAMWAINLSLGSYQIFHLPDDYPDTNQYRDCIYYRCPLRWPAKDIADNSTIGPNLEQGIGTLLYRN